MAQSMNPMLYNIAYAQQAGERERQTRAQNMYDIQLKRQKEAQEQAARQEKRRRIVSGVMQMGLGAALAIPTGGMSLGMAAGGLGTAMNSPGLTAAGGMLGNVMGSLQHQNFLKGMQTPGAAPTPATPGNYGTATPAGNSIGHWAAGSPNPMVSPYGGYNPNAMINPNPWSP